MKLKLIEDRRRGPLRIIQYPQAGRFYSAGADVGQGVRDGDLSAISIIDMETLDQVAYWYGYLDPRAFGRKLGWLGYFYNTAYITAEANNNGQPCLYELKDMGYPNLYRSISYDKVGRIVQQQLGFWSDTKRRPQLWALMRRTILEGYGRINAPEQVDEMRHIHFEEHGNELRETHEKRKHDDLTVAWGMSLIGRDAAFARGEVEIKAKPASTHDEADWEREDSASEFQGDDA